jgi:large subunit ribosomal protein L4
VHGPQPRDYHYRFPRRKLRGALRAALSAKLEGKALTVVEAFALEGPKTKDFRKVLETLGSSGKVLVVDSRENRNLRLSSRNLPDVKLVPGSGINIYDVVNHGTLVFTREAILEVQEVLSR